MSHHARNQHHKNGRTKMTSLHTDIPWKSHRLKTNQHLISLLNGHEGVHPSLNGV